MSDTFQHSSRTSTPLGGPQQPHTAASSRPPSPFSRPLPPPVQIIRSIGGTMHVTTAAAPVTPAPNTPPHGPVNTASSAVSNSTTTGNQTPPNHLLPNPLTRPNTPPSFGNNSNNSLLSGGGGGNAPNSGSSVAALPLTGKALEHWLSLQAGNSRTNSPSPSPRNPHLPTRAEQEQPHQQFSTPLSKQKKVDDGGAASPQTPTSGGNKIVINTSGDSNDGVEMAQQQQHHPAINPAHQHHHLGSHSSSPTGRLHGAIRIHDGVPPKTLADIEAEEKVARDDLLKAAAATNFVELALGIACLQRSEAVLQSKIGEEAYGVFAKKAASIQQQYHQQHHSSSSPSVSGLTKRVMLTIHELGEALVRKPPATPVRSFATQVDATTLPRLSSEFANAEEVARLRIQLAASDSRSALESDFLSMVGRLALEEAAESGELLERALSDLDGESKRRMQLEVEQLVTTKKSQHAKHVAEEMTAQLAREKESVDCERQARVGIERALEEANEEVDKQTVSQTHLQTQAARAKVTVAATKFATMDHSTQVGGGGAGGGSVRSAKDCGELTLNPKLVPHAGELTAFHTEAKITLRGETLERGGVQVDLLSSGGATINIFRDNNINLSSSSSGMMRFNNEQALLLSSKVSAIASIQRLFERENAVRLVIGQAAAAAAASSSSPDLVSSPSASLRPASSSSTFGPSSLSSIVNEHAVEVDIMTWTRRDLECLMEALAIARSTFSSRCYVQRIWGSGVFSSLAPTPLEVDYRIRIQAGGGGGSSFEDSFMLASSATLKQGAAAAAAAGAFSPNNTVSSLNATSSSSSSAASIFISLHRMTQCRIAFLSADDIFLGNITDETLAEIAASAQLVVLWKFVAAASSSSSSTMAVAAGGKSAAGGGGGLSGVIPFGKAQQWKNWSVVISDSSTMPPYIESGGGSTHMLVAATKEAQTWLTAYETTKREFCAQLAVTVTLLGSRLSFSTCQVPVTVASRMKRKQIALEMEEEEEEDDGASGRRGGSEFIMKGVEEEEATENNEPATLALIHDEIFCSNADAVFLLSGSSQRQLVTESLSMGINTSSSSSSSNSNSSSSTLIQDGPSPVSWIKLRDGVAAESAASALSVSMCSSSFLPSALGEALWRPPSSAASSSSSSSPSALATGGMMDPKPHSVVVPLRRVQCTILGQPPSVSAASPSSSSPTRSLSLLKPQQLVVKSLSVKLLPGMGDGVVVVTLPESPSFSTSTLSCQLVSPCIEPAKMSCSSSRNSSLVFHATELRNNKNDSSSGFAVETITGDRVRLASDIMTLKLLPSSNRTSTPNNNNNNNKKKTRTIFGNFSLLNAAGLVPGDGETVRCVFRLFSVCDGASRIAGECKMLIAMPARL